MNMRRWLLSVVMVLALVAASHGSLSAQVIEVREGESNPAGVIFRATLYGAGTGLVLGGAYALVHDGDTSTQTILSWGVAGGAAAGALIGVLYWATRSEPAGSAGAAGMIQLERHDHRIGVPTVRVTQREGAAGGTHSAMEASLLQIRF